MWFEMTYELPLSLITASSFTAIKVFNTTSVTQARTNFVPLDHHLALLLPLLLSFDVIPAPLGMSWSAEGPHMTGNAAGKGRDDPPLDAVAPFQG